MGGAKGYLSPQLNYWGRPPRLPPKSTPMFVSSEGTFTKLLNWIVGFCRIIAQEITNLMGKHAFCRNANASGVYICIRGLNTGTPLPRMWHSINAFIILIHHYAIYPWSGRERRAILTKGLTNEWKKSFASTNPDIRPILVWSEKTKFGVLNNYDQKLPNGRYSKTHEKLLKIIVYSSPNRGPKFKKIRFFRD